MAFKFLILVTLAISLTLSFSPASSQITTPCTPAMMTTFSPCMNFVTNNSSSINGTSPNSDCCNALRSLMSNGKDCLCLIATGSVPFQIPINRTLAVSLPRACNTPGVPLQCKAAGAPVPAPGPLANGPALSPNAAPSPQASAEPLSPGLAPEADGTPTTPTTTGGGVPTSSTGSRAGVTPSSAANPSYSISPLLVVAVFGAIALKSYY